MGGAQRVSSPSATECPTIEQSPVDWPVILKLVTIEELLRATQPLSGSDRHLQVVVESQRSYQPSQKDGISSCSHSLVLQKKL